MKFTKTIAIVALVTISTISYSQKKYLNLIEISGDYGISNDMGPSGLYKTLFSELIRVENKTFAKTRNYNFSYARFITPNNGLKASFGLSNFGFDFTGITSDNNIKITDTYRVRYLEWGLSYVRRIALTPNSNLMVEPGVRFHSDGSPTSNTIRFNRTDSWSFSGYAGLEIPMIGNHLFTTFGLQLKLPIERYNRGNTFAPANYPYFVGLKVGINFQL